MMLQPGDSPQILCRLRCPVLDLQDVADHGCQQQCIPFLTPTSQDRSSVGRSQPAAYSLAALSMSSFSCAENLPNTTHLSQTSSAHTCLSAAELAVPCRCSLLAEAGQAQSGISGTHDHPATLSCNFIMRQQDSSPALLHIRALAAVLPRHAHRKLWQAAGTPSLVRAGSSLSLCRRLR